MRMKWAEKWLCGGSIQTVRIRIIENADYTEQTVVTISPIEDASEAITARIPKRR